MRIVIVDSNERWEAFKKGVKRGFKRTGEWIADNKETIIALTPFIITGVVTVCKVITKVKINGKTQELKDLYCYDRSLGHYWKLRRELTNDEWLEIDARKKAGERLADILYSFKVLA